MLFDVLERALIVKAVGHGQIFGMVGDGDVFVAAGEAASAISRMRVFSVGGVGVHVDVAANVALLDEVGRV